MSPKFLLTAGLIVGSTIGAYIPVLWGDASLFSMTSLILSFIGGLIGVWAGYWASQNIDW